MTWERALEADARLAAKNAVLIRAAIRQAFDAERAFTGYQNTQPDDSLTLPQQRVRARSWAIMNVRPNMEPLKQVVLKLWAEAYALGDTAAREAIAEARMAKKADTQSTVDWSKWKPGDAVAALLLKPPRAFQQLLQAQGITFKGFSDTTLTDIGNAIGEAIHLGLDAKRSAKLITQHVANPARALSIAITEQNRAISQATVNRYREAGLQEQEWLVFEPCEICAKNANQKVQIGAPFPSGDTQPPAHPHCRCALAPVIPGFDDPANTAGNFVPPTEIESGQIPTRRGTTIEAVYPERWTQITPDQHIDRLLYVMERAGRTPELPVAELMKKDLRDYLILARKEDTILVAPYALKKGLTPQMVETFAQYYDEVRVKLPTWHKKTKFLQREATLPFHYELVISDDAKGRILAYTRLHDSTIYFNADHVIKEINSTKADTGNWHMPASRITNPVKYTIAHELGHTVDTYTNIYRGKFSGAAKRRFKGQMSEYGKESPEESYAEAFADWILNPNPSPISLAYAEHYGWDKPEPSNIRKPQVASFGE